MLKSIFAIAAIFSAVLTNAENDGYRPLCRWGIGSGCNRTPRASITAEVAGESASILLTTVTSNIIATETQMTTLPGVTQVKTQTNTQTQFFTETFTQTALMTETQVATETAVLTENNVVSVTSTVPATQIQTFTTFVPSTFTEVQTSTQTIITTIFATSTVQETVTAKFTLPAVTVTKYSKQTCSGRGSYGRGYSDDRSEGDYAVDDSY